MSGSGFWNHVGRILDLNILGGKFTPVPYLGTTTSTDCVKLCDAGYGCVFTGTDFSETNQYCMRCPARFYSPNDSAQPCDSCDIDSSWWAALIKSSLKPNNDQSACVVDSAVFAWMPLLIGFGLFCVFLTFAMRCCYRHKYREHLLHKLVRSRNWTGARELLRRTGGTRSTAPREKRDLICRPGKDGKSPIEIVLEDPGAPKTKCCGLRGGGGGGGRRTGTATMTTPLMNAVTVAVSGGDHHHDGAESLRLDLVEDMLSVNRVCANLSLADRVTPNSCLLDRVVKPLGVRFFNNLPSNMVKVNWMNFLGIAVLNGVLWGMWFGSVLDAGTNVPLPGQCGTVCILFGVLSGFGIVIPGLIFASIFAHRVALFLHRIIQNSGGSSAAISGGVSLVVVLMFTCIGAWTSPLIGGFFGGSLGTQFAEGLGSIAGGFYGAFIGELIVGPFWGVVLSSPVDPMFSALKHVLDNIPSNAYWPPADRLWPLLWASLESAGPSTWKLLLPVTPRADRALRELELAQELAKELGRRRFISKGATNSGLNVLHTLVQAHIGGIVNAENCATCITEVVRLQQGNSVALAIEQVTVTIESQQNLRLEKMKTSTNWESGGAGGNAALVITTPVDPIQIDLDANGSSSGASPAELAMVSAQSRCIKEAVLVVVFERYAIISLDDTVYQSTTCKVYRAEDLDTGGIVAIKLFIDSEHFAKECDIRALLRGRANIGAAVVMDLALLEGSCLLHPGNDSADVTALLTEFSGGAIVMPIAEFDLHERLSSTRVAGVSAVGCAEILYPIADALSRLHEVGIVHGDVKPRNIVFVDETWKMIDMDAAVRKGAPIDTSPTNFKWTSGFAPPELMRAQKSGGTIVATEKMDAFAFGVVAYEICTGQRLFPQDICNSNLVSEEDARRLCVWLSAGETALAAIFNSATAAQCSAIEKEDATHLVRWCLHGDPDLRPTMSEIKRHRFLTRNSSSPLGGESISPPAQTILRQVPSALRGVTAILDPIIAHDTCRPKYHVFISHMQIEASGDVGTLFFLFEQMGLYGWRDMNQKDLTEAGMRQGVYDSDVFILFLTNSVLSRPFCLKEISWALEFGKPVIIVTETEERFSPFDCGRWKLDKLKKNTHVWPHEWVVDAELGMQYDQMKKKGKMVNGTKQKYPHIVDFIEQTVSRSGGVLPFRRREFEVDALASEIVRRASKRVKWGQVLPPSAADDAANLSATRRVAIIGGATGYTRKIVKDITTTIHEMTEGKTVISDVVETAPATETTTHVVAVLSKALIDEMNTGEVDARRTPIAAQLHQALEVGLTLVYVYVESEGVDVWDFGAFYGITAENRVGDIKESIGNHEALKYREKCDGGGGADEETLQYEHVALVLEMLKRMRA